MALRKAADSFALGQPSYNPLWKHIYRSFQQSLLATVRDRHWNRLLYVENRIDDNGVTGDDVRAYVDASDRRPMLIKGPAGIGKTTFLHHAMADHIKTRDDVLLIWIDVATESSRDQPVVAQVRHTLAQKFGARIKQFGPDRLAWYKFLLSRNDDGFGTAELLREGLEAAERVPDHLIPVLHAFLSEIRSRPLDDVRSQIAFCRTVLHRTPCIVIDNVDQLHAEQLIDLVHFVCLLANGPQGDDAPEDAHAAVILAMRPISTARVGEATQFVTTGNLRPPLVSEVLTRRVEAFLENFSGRVARGTILSDDAGRTVELRTIFDEDVASKKPDELVGRAVRMLTRALVEESQDGHRILEMVQTLTNDNTRLSLLAASQFVASGHLDWRGLLDVLAERRGIHEVLTFRKAFMAVILGVGKIYDTRSAWLCNLFHDSARDRTSVLIRLRVLRAIEATDEGAQPAELARDFHELFGYSEARVIGTCENLQSLGLLEELKPKRLTLTKAAQMYLSLMLCNFEYLQHVIVDSCVDLDHLVPCTRTDEQPAIRFDRVLKFAEWVRYLEVEDLARALTHQERKLYQQYFESDLICAAFAKALVGIVDVLQRIDRRREWDAARAKALDFQSICNFAEVDEAARELAREELTRLAQEITPTSEVAPSDRQS